MSDVLLISRHKPHQTQQDLVARVLGGDLIYLCDIEQTKLNKATLIRLSRNYGTNYIASTSRIIGFKVLCAGLNTVFFTKRSRKQNKPYSAKEIVIIEPTGVINDCDIKINKFSRNSLVPDKWVPTHVIIHKNGDKTLVQKHRSKLFTEDEVLVATFKTKYSFKKCSLYCDGEKTSSQIRAIFK